MTWWQTALWLLALSGLNALLVPRITRWTAARRRRAGTVLVSVRGLDGPTGRWRIWRARRQDDRLVLSPQSVHGSAGGPVLLSLDPDGRAVPWRERLRVLTGATQAVAGESTGGPVEIAGSPADLCWLRAQLRSALPD